MPKHKSSPTTSSDSTRSRYLSDIATYPARLTNGGYWFSSGPRPASKDSENPEMPSCSPPPQDSPETKGVVDPKRRVSNPSGSNSSASHPNSDVAGSNNQGETSSSPVKSLNLKSSPAAIPLHGPEQRPAGAGSLSSSTSSKQLVGASLINDENPKTLLPVEPLPVSPGPKKSKVFPPLTGPRISSAKIKACLVPNLVLPSFEDTFFAPPRSFLPPVKQDPPPSSQLTKALGLVQNFLFPAPSHAVRREKAEAVEVLDSKQQEMRDYLQKSQHPSTRLPKSRKLLGLSQIDQLRNIRKLVVIGIHDWSPGPNFRKHGGFGAVWNSGSKETVAQAFNGR